ncbi:hypothetical protein CYMTET_18494, partial [Cymbomonas tetramitiformis]
VCSTCYDGEECTCFLNKLELVEVAEVQEYTPPEDAEAPSLQLLGNGELVRTTSGTVVMVHSLQQGAQWAGDPGVVAWDAVDGNLTDQVSAYGAAAVSTHAPTTPDAPHVITYMVNDAAGNTARVRRRVYVHNPCGDPAEAPCPSEEQEELAEATETVCSINGLCNSLELEDQNTEEMVAAPPLLRLIGPQLVEIAQGDPYLACLADAPLDMVCDRGAEAEDGTDGVLTSYIRACAPAGDAKAGTTSNFAAAGLAACQLDTSAGGREVNISFTVQNSAGAQATVVRTVVITPHCAPWEHTCADRVSCSEAGVCQAGLAAAQAEEPPVDAPPALNLMVSEALGEFVTVAKGAPYDRCPAGHTPTVEVLCEPGAEAVDAEEGDISRHVLACPPDSCIDMGCPEHEFVRKGLAGCLNTSAAVGTVFSIQFVVLDSALPPNLARVTRYVTIGTPCAEGEVFCEELDGSCGTVACEHRVQLELKRAGDVHPPVVSTLGPEHLTLDYGEGTRGGTLQPCAEYAQAPPPPSAESGGRHGRALPAGCYAVAWDEEDGDLSAQIGYRQRRECGAPSGREGALCGAPACRLDALEQGACQPGEYMYEYYVADASGLRGAATVTVTLRESARITSVVQLEAGTEEQARAQAEMLQEVSSNEARAFRTAIAALLSDHGSSSGAPETAPDDVEVINATADGTLVDVEFSILVAVVEPAMDQAIAAQQAQLLDSVDGAENASLAAYLVSAAVASNATLPTVVAQLGPEFSEQERTKEVDVVEMAKGALQGEVWHLSAVAKELEAQLEWKTGPAVASAHATDGLQHNGISSAFTSHAEASIHDVLMLKEGAAALSPDIDVSAAAGTAAVGHIAADYTAERIASAWGSTNSDTTAAAFPAGVCPHRTPSTGSVRLALCLPYSTEEACAALVPPPPAPVPPFVPVQGPASTALGAAVANVTGAAVESGAAKLRRLLARGSSGGTAGRGDGGGGGSSGMSSTQAGVVNGENELGSLQAVLQDQLIGDGRRVSTRTDFHFRRYLARRNLLVGGLLVEQRRRQVLPAEQCTPRRFSHLEAYCVTSAPAVDRFGNDPVLVPGTSLTDPSLLGEVAQYYNPDPEAGQVEYRLWSSHSATTARPFAVHSLTEDLFVAYLEGAVTRERIFEVLRYLGEGRFLDHGTHELVVHSLLWNSQQQVLLKASHWLRVLETFSAWLQIIALGAVDIAEPPGGSTVAGVGLLQVGTRVEVFWPGGQSGYLEEPWEEWVDRCSWEEVGGKRGRGSGREQWFARFLDALWGACRAGGPCLTEHFRRSHPNALVLLLSVAGLTRCPAQSCRLILSETELRQHCAREHQLRREVARVVEEGSALRGKLRGRPGLGEAPGDRRAIAEADEERVLRDAVRLVQAGHAARKGREETGVGQAGAGNGAHVAEAGAIAPCWDRQEAGSQQWCASGLAGARLMVLLKEDNGNNVRPIACGEVLRKLVAKVICCAKSFKARFCGRRQDGEHGGLRAVQVGVAVKGRVDLCVHTLQAALDRHPEWVCVKADAKNAFNAVYREAMFEAIERDFPELWAWTDRCCGVEGNLRFRLGGVDGSVMRFVKPKEGTPQGDPLGPLYMAAPLQRVHERHSAVFICAYLDDAFFLGPPAVAALTYGTYIEQAAAIGLDIQPMKSAGFSLVGDTSCFEDGVPARVSSAAWLGGFAQVCEDMRELFPTVTVGAADLEAESELPYVNSLQAAMQKVSEAMGLVEEARRANGHLPPQVPKADNIRMLSNHNREENAGEGGQVDVDGDEDEDGDSWRTEEAAQGGAIGEHGGCAREAEHLSCGVRERAPPRVFRESMEGVRQEAEHLRIAGIQGEGATERLYNSGPVQNSGQ